MQLATLVEVELQKARAAEEGGVRPADVSALMTRINRVSLPLGEATHTEAEQRSAEGDTSQPGGEATRQMFGAKHLVVMYQGSRRAPPGVTRTKEEARARAAEAMRKARKPGAIFSDVVAEYSDEPGATRRGGDLGQFPRNAMVPEFQEALEKLAIGQVSDVVETPFGFHVVVRTK